jgi:DNA repair ATPase RecN
MSKGKIYIKAPRFPPQTFQYHILSQPESQTLELASKNQNTTLINQPNRMDATQALLRRCRHRHYYYLMLMDLLDFLLEEAERATGDDLEGQRETLQELNEVSEELQNAWENLEDAWEELEDALVVMEQDASGLEELHEALDDFQEALEDHDPLGYTHPDPRAFY